jgi:endonuclease/exonuclease/phosphatase family metal-dependent hydrolase
MSFNIRYGTANDGENDWERRKEFVVDTIRAFDPDLLGTQETLKFQRDYIHDQLPGYGVIGVGRNDGRDDGEMMALYYRQERFEELEHGHFWLSEHPDEIGSKSWDSSLPRMATWVRLRDRRHPDAPPLTFFNTHFDHIGTTARLESARLLRTRIDTASESGSVVVTGDFNCGEGSPPYAALFGQTNPNNATVIDAFRRMHPEPLGDEGTFSGFRADQTGGPRIDWIAASPEWTIETAAIDRTSRDGRTPSDHWPVTARLTR